MKNDGTVYDHATAKEEQDRRAPITPAARELTPAQLELVAGGGSVDEMRNAFVGTKR